MSKWICVTCGTQYPERDTPPEHCSICEDERQYIGLGGQRWTTLEEMKATGYRNAFYEHEPHLWGLETVSEFAIGQHAKLIRTPHGNILWDCISYIDDVTVDLIRGIGGIQAIAISHPHFYSSMVEWAERFDARIYLHARDRRWVMHPSDRIEFWDGTQVELNPEVTLVHVGGHFAGSTVLLWKSGANGKGVLLTGDTVSVSADRRWVSFMYSFPNRIPLSAVIMKCVRSRLEPLSFDRLYGTQADSVVEYDAKGVVIRSVERYLDALRRTEER
ncbi:MBL fold metallo-hydrolase [Alicyclobacillus tolerans]|uniref:Glyoxylase-like metal-dependent hydrolase (Beta-lactamase superfamily II) n=2 Tax=Alicyclobacillus tolerans TaxID=90970 RepID=A0ABT9LX30_9BACL|nr:MULTISPECIES: MBL fold metallo-hydrolase [Alicyclobacillus]MDP9728828.1 glyoxylase-like metal-dependent hydrolase (beta-lactamase superfamily II) [Alicyclobacillus tengchongensis]SHK70499.1 Metallo-beta-lactamase superfamily protein [Alicyclobacillus montanus]